MSLSNHNIYYVLKKSNMLLINLHPNEYSQEFHYCPFTVKSDKFVGSCNTLNDLSKKICVSNKRENLNLSVFSMIKGENESKALNKACIGQM